jgi:hypothetical protein
MNMKIQKDAHAPTASIEWMIARPLPDYDLLEIEAAVPRDVDPMLASQGFKDLLDEARVLIDGKLAATGIEIVQLTGAICADGGVFRPGIWLVLRDSHASPGGPMPEVAQARVTAVANEIPAALQIA